MKGGGYFTAVDGIDIYYSVEGPDDGIPVLLLHGWVCDQTDWAFQIPFLLSLGFRVIGMDYRGHGHSSVTDAVTKFDPVTLAEDAAALLAHLGVHHGSSSNRDNNGTHHHHQQQAIVMGHSLGGVVAHQLAQRHGYLVRGTVLVDAAYTMTPPMMDHVVARLDAADPPDRAAVAATDFFSASGLYAADHGTPAWLAPAHQRRAWVVAPRVVVETFKQLRAHLGESGAAYRTRTTTITPGGDGGGGGEDSNNKRKIMVPRLVTCAVESSAEIERQAGMDERVDRVEVIPAGHLHHIIEPDRFNGVLKEWLVARQWVKQTNGTKTE
ncbi:hypothetical protein PG994_004156 [Apiospora phragmitis]|uniref:AB hydrolase-1 domain-containing protein n=1 Tax=Apiospora phragmitis TaxID=2905665 RepID=A0ABR1VQ27_9PEZI